MRTKTLLLAAVLGAAGAASTSAQVFSVNTVGYTTVNMGANQFTMVANQLDATPDNKVTTLFAAPPNETQVFKYNPATGGYVSLSFNDGSWEGDDLNLVANPGQGIFVYAKTAFSNTFAGSVQNSSSVPVATGFSVLSSPLPLAGAIDTALKMPVANGDQVYQYNPATGGYTANSFNDGAWEGDGGGAAPDIRIGESFFYFRAVANGATSWTRTYAPATGPGNP